MRIGGLGICASAGYMAAAATRNPSLYRIALVAPWLHDRAIVDQVYGGATAVAGLIEAGRAAASRFAADGPLTRITAADAADPDVLMPGDHYYSDPRRGRIDAWPNRFNVASWEPWLRFDAQAFAGRITQPTLIIHSESAAIPHGAHRFHDALVAPKSALWLDGVTQFDFYDEDAAVAAASDAVVAHFFEASVPSPR